MLVTHVTDQYVVSVNFFKGKSLIVSKLTGKELIIGLESYNRLSALLTKLQVLADYRDINKIIDAICSAYYQENEIDNFFEPLNYNYGLLIPYVPDYIFHKIIDVNNKATNPVGSASFIECTEITKYEAGDRFIDTSKINSIRVYRLSEDRSRLVGIEINSSVLGSSNCILHADFYDGKESRLLLSHNPVDSANKYELVSTFMGKRKVDINI